MNLQVPKRLGLWVVALWLCCAPFAVAKDRSLDELFAELPAPSSDAAQVVFLKPSRGLPPTALFEIEGEQRRLLDVLKSGRKLVVSVPPGEHLFMTHTKKRTYSDAPTHFLRTQLEAGRRYFVLVRYLYGEGFQLRPIRPKGAADYDMHNPEFVQWLAKTKVKPGPRQLVTAYQRSAAHIGKAQAVGWEAWLQKTDAQRAELTLRVVDGL